MSPLSDSRVNDSLLQIVTHFNEALLQLVDVTYTTFICTLLHGSPDLVVDGVQIWTVWRPEVRTDEPYEVDCRITVSLQQLLSASQTGDMIGFRQFLRTMSFDTLKLQIAMN